MKKHFKLLVGLLLALSMAISVVACSEPNDDKKPGGDNGGQTEVVEKTYYDVTVVNGSIKGTQYNHDKIEKDASVTLVADAPVGADTFTHWAVNGNSVSTDAEYTFKVTESVTVTAVYGTEFSKWDGNYPEEAPATYSEDAENKVVHIGSAEALAYWADSVTNQKEGTDKTQYKFSTFDWGVYTRETSGKPETPELIESAVKSASKPDNKWTVSIDCNIDFDGNEWTPIIDQCYALHEITLDGNNHVFKNFYTAAYGDGKYVNGTMKAAGFFGQISGGNITIRNLTFDTAKVEVVGMDAGMQNVSLLVGYAVNNNHYKYFKNAQETRIENVNIINSLAIGSGNSKKMGFMIGRVGCGTETQNYDNKQHVIISGCTIADSKMVGSSILGGMIGHIYTGDKDQNIHDRYMHVIDAFNNSIENVTVISSANGNEDDISYKFGTLGTWDVLEWGTTGTPGTWGNPGWTQHPVDFEYGDTSVNFIDLHVGTGSVVDGKHAYAPVNTNAAMMKTTLEAVSDNGDPLVKDIFVCADMKFDPDGMGYPDWSGSDKQVIYIVGGAKLEGLDTTGSEVRYISGARNAAGELVVTDAEGNEIGIWKISLNSYEVQGQTTYKYEGAFQAK